MTPSRAVIVLLSSLVVLLAACGPSPTDKAAEERNRKLISDLQGQLTQAQEELQKQRERNGELLAQAESLTESVKQLKMEAARKTIAEAKPGRQAPSDKKTPQDEGRIELLGAKAVAEYRAAQLSRRLEDLSKDLARKESEMESIRQKAQHKDSEVAQLRVQIERLQTQEQTRSNELSQRLAAIGKEVQERSDAEKRLKQELDEKTGLLNALKNAVSDSAILKTGAETEVTRLRAELADKTSRLDSALKDREQREQEADHWRRATENLGAEAEKLRAALDRAEKEMNFLRVRAEDLSGRLQALQASTAEDEGEEETGPSQLDRILRVPKAEGSSPSGSGLY